MIDTSPQKYFNSEDLICLITTKKLGTFKQGSKNNIDKENYLKLAKLLNIDKSQFVFAEQIHENKICEIKKEDQNKVLSACDGLITNTKDLFLVITVADCLPIFIYDSNKRVCCVIHAGWKSLVNNIISEAVDKFTQQFNSNLSDIKAFIGPGIAKCHFEIQDDIIDNFDKKFIQQQEGKKFIDLKALALDHLLQKGINLENVKVSDDCSHCQKDKYFSFRRDHPKIIEAMAAVIGIKSNDK